MAPHFKASPEEAELIIKSHFPIASSYLFCETKLSISIITFLSEAVRAASFFSFSPEAMYDFMNEPPKSNTTSKITCHLGAPSERKNVLILPHIPSFCSEVDAPADAILDLFACEENALPLFWLEQRGQPD